MQEDKAPGASTYSLRATGYTSPRCSPSAPLAIIQGLLLPPLHHPYPLSAEMAFVKRACLLGIGHCKTSRQTGLSRTHK
jgi:hypothetical protein